MHYTQFFRSLRESRGLTHEGLAELAGCHRNTITNIESGRAVKFKTLADIMEKLGYPASSPQMRSLALLWLESVSGIDFTRPEQEEAARRTVAELRKATAEAASKLENEIVRSGLSGPQIDLLHYVVKHPEMLNLLDDMRRLAVSLTNIGPSEKS